MVTTDIETGKPDYIKIDHVFEQMEALRASSALPLVSEIVEYKGKRYMDGGLSDSLPIDFMENLGFDKLIVVLTRPKGYRKEPSKTSKRIYKLFYCKYPEFVDVASNRHIHYNKSIEKIEALEKTGNLYAIRPAHALEVGRLEKDPEKFEAIYQEGLEQMRNEMSHLKTFLGDN